MGYIVDKAKAQTVGELIDALAKFDRSMPLECGVDDGVVIYRDKPMKGETRDDRPKGRICINGDDGCWDD